jgi:hypothetical protein
VAIPLEACVGEVLESNFEREREIDYPDRGIRGFPQSLQKYSRIVLRLGYNRFLPSPFQFIFQQSI